MSVFDWVLAAAVVFLGWSNWGISSRVDGLEEEIVYLKTQMRDQLGLDTRWPSLRDEG